MPEDTKNIQVGSLIGLMVLPGDDWKSVTIPESEMKQEKKTTAPVSQPSHSPAASPTPTPIIQKPQVTTSSPTFDLHSLDNLYASFS